MKILSNLLGADQVSIFLKFRLICSFLLVTQANWLVSGYVVTGHDSWRTASSDRTIHWAVITWICSRFALWLPRAICDVLRIETDLSWPTNSWVYFTILNVQLVVYYNNLLLKNYKILAHSAKFPAIKGLLIMSIIRTELGPIIDRSEGVTRGFIPC